MKNIMNISRKDAMLNLVIPFCVFCFKRFLVPAIILGTLICPSLYAQTSVPDLDRWITNGEVRTIKADEGFTYIGGNFSHIGPNTGTAAMFTTNSDEPDLSFPNVNDEVWVIIPDGSGGWYIGGRFTQVGSQPRSSIARINGDGSLHPWTGPSGVGFVYAMALHGNNLIFGGTFQSVGGQQRNYIASVSTLTGALSGDFNPGANGTVNHLKIHDGSLYVGGVFSTIGGQVRRGIAKLDPVTGQVDAGWNTNLNTQSSINTMAIDGNHLYIGGDFFPIGGPRTRLSRLEIANGSIDPAWSTDANGRVHAIAMSGDFLYIGGVFSHVDDIPRTRLAKINKITGTVDAQWTPEATADVLELAVGPDGIYAVGMFNTISTVQVLRISKLDFTFGQPDLDWNPKTNGTTGLTRANVVAIQGNNVYIGGAFSIIGGYARSNIARISNETGEADADWAPSTSGLVTSIDLSDDDVFIGGAFSTVNGVNRNRLAKLNKSEGDLDLNWNPNANGQVNSVVFAGEHIYAGGFFNTVGGEPRNRLVKLDNINGSVVTDWDAQIVGNSVSSIVLSNNHVYVGGNFTEIAGTAVGMLARLNPSNAALDQDWNPMANLYVNTLHLDGNMLYVGGNFFTIAGINANRIARFNISTGAVDAGWAPNFSAEVIAIRSYGNSVFVGGSFSQLNEQDLPRLVKLNTDTGLPDMDWTPSPNLNVRALEISGERLWVGGAFTLISGYRSHMLASFSGLDAPPGVAYTAEITGPYEGWRILSAPTGQATYAEMLDNLWTQGYPGSGNPDFSTNVYWYDETIRLWNVPQSATNTIGTSSDGVSAPGKAMIVYVFEDDDANGIPDGWPKEISVSGAATTGDIVINLPRTEIDGDFLAGWHIIGNPYPFTINWFDLVADVALSNVLPVVFFHDTTMNNGNGGYKMNFGTHTPDLPEHILHDGLIAPFQGFWIRTSPDVPSGTVTFREQYEADESGTLFDQPGPQSNISLVFAVTHEAGSEAAALIPSLTPLRVERPMLLSPEVISFGFPYDNDRLLVAHELNFMENEDFVIPVSFASVHEGLFELNVYGGNDLEGYEIVLSDFLTGDEVYLTSGSGYQFYNTPEVQNSLLHTMQMALPVKERLSNGGLKSLESHVRFQVRIRKLSGTNVDVHTGLPAETMLSQNYPNPFNPTTTIAYALPEGGNVRLDVFNIQGQRVATLVNGHQPAGHHNVSFDASRLASGTYIYRLQAGGATITRMMMLVK